MIWFYFPKYRNAPKIGKNHINQIIFEVELEHLIKIESKKQNILINIRRNYLIGSFELEWYCYWHF